MKHTLLLLAVAFAGCTKDTYVEGIAPVPVPPAQPTVTAQVRSIQNNYRGTYIRTDNGSVTCDTPVFQWTMQAVTNSTTEFYFKYGTGYLAVNSSNQVILSLQQTAGSVWTIEPVDATNSRIISNAGGYLNVENGPLVCGSVLSGWLSARWRIAP